MFVPASIGGFCLFFWCVFMVNTCCLGKWSFLLHNSGSGVMVKVLVLPELATPLGAYAPMPLPHLSCFTNHTPFWASLPPSPTILGGTQHRIDQTEPHPMGLRCPGGLPWCDSMGHERSGQANVRVSQGLNLSEKQRHHNGEQ